MEIVGFRGIWMVGIGLGNGLGIRFLGILEGRAEIGF